MPQYSLRTRPVESHSGARENIIAGPYHSPPHFVCLEIETPKASRGRKRGGGGVPSRLTIRLGIRGSVVNSPSGVRGGAPAENRFYAYFRSERSYLEHHFQYFRATAGPRNVAGPGKTFPLFPPLDGPVNRPRNLHVSRYIVALITTPRYRPDNVVLNKSTSVSVTDKLLNKTVYMRVERRYTLFKSDRMP